MVMVPPIFADLQYKALDFGLVCKMCLHQFGSLQVSLDQSQHPRGYNEWEYLPGMGFSGTHEELPVDEENSAPLIGGSASGRTLGFGAELCPASFFGSEFMSYFSGFGTLFLLVTG
ncbi:hypothetical protein ACFX14_039714 [Malus domestica]